MSARNSRGGRAPFSLTTLQLEPGGNAHGNAVDPGSAQERVIKHHRGFDEGDAREGVAQYGSIQFESVVTLRHPQGDSVRLTSCAHAQYWGNFIGYRRRKK